MGNSEVGHLNLGAGRVVMQSLSFVQAAIDDGSLFENEVLTELCDGVAPGRALHLMGLVSDGGVHSDLRHLLALLDLAQRRGVQRVYLHAFTDGRDTAPDGGRGYLAQVRTHIDARQPARIASVIGRYWAMDRDHRWDRTKRAYDAIVLGRAEHRAESADEAIVPAYERGETDEFVAPTLVVPARRGGRHARGRRRRAVVQLPGRPGAADLSHALLDGPDWDGFERERVPRALRLADAGRRHARHAVRAEPRRARDAARRGDRGRGPARSTARPRPRSTRT
jgi:2,3-bisphosphoglycerate-independent phosphoglycerate mutase